MADNDTIVRRLRKEAGYLAVELPDCEKEQTIAWEAADTIESLMADARRYRWLKDKTMEKHEFYGDVWRWTVAKERGGSGQCFRGEGIDTEIDAALADGEGAK